MSDPVAALMPTQLASPPLPLSIISDPGLTPTTHRIILWPCLSKTTQGARGQTTSTLQATLQQQHPLTTENQLRPVGTNASPPTAKYYLTTPQIRRGPIPPPSSGAQPASTSIRVSTFPVHPWPHPSTVPWFGCAYPSAISTHPSSVRKAQGKVSRYQPGQLVTMFLLKLASNLSSPKVSRHKVISPGHTHTSDDPFLSSIGTRATIVSTAGLAHGKACRLPHRKMLMSSRICVQSWSPSTTSSNVARKCY